MFKNVVFLVSWMLATGGTLLPLHAQPHMPLALQRLTAPIMLDGVVDELAWATIKPLPVVMYQPIYQGAMTERTEIYVAYDDRYLYVGARLLTEYPSTISADSYERDDWDAEGDFLNLVLDTFNDNENAVSFSTTPNGIRLDSEITNDAEGDWLNTNWNMVWDAATSRSDEGWSAEMRIPFSSLRFKAEGGRVVMGLSINRFISARNERHIFPAIPPTATTALWKPSLWQDVVFEDLTPRHPLYVSPYVLAGLRQTSAPIMPQNPEQADDQPREIGLDLKYGLTNSLTFDLTVNTDFAQVEVDDEQVNLTRFSLFYPEKRLFFQERSGLFQFELGDGGRLFHSRRIGLTEDGRPVRILGGARLTGHVKGWDLGLMGMQTARSTALPSETFGVLRLRRPVVNAYSYVGAMMTSRMGWGGASSVAYGLDGRLRLVGNDYLTASWAQTFDDDERTRRMPFLTSGRLYAAWERRTNIGLGYAMTLTHAGRAFDPTVGFSNRRSFTLTEQQVSYGWFARDASRIRLFLPALRNAVYVRTTNGSLESAHQELAWTVELKSGARVAFTMQRQYEDLLSAFALSDAVSIPSGSYAFYIASAAFETASSRRLRAYIDVEAGSFFDGRRSTIRIQPTWVASAHLRIGLGYEVTRLHFPEREERLTAHLGRLRVNAALNTKLSTQAFVQYNSTDARWSTNLRFRYNVREGTDLYVVFNRQVIADEQLAQPTEVPMESQALLVKYTHTFR